MLRKLSWGITGSAVDAVNVEDVVFIDTVVAVALMT